MGSNNNNMGDTKDVKFDAGYFWKTYGRLTMHIFIYLRSQQEKRVRMSLLMHIYTFVSKSSWSFFMISNSILDYEQLWKKIKYQFIISSRCLKICSFHIGCIAIILFGTFYLQRDTCFHFTRCFMRLKCKYNQSQINSLGTWIFNMILSIKTNWTLHSQHAISLWNYSWNIQTFANSR